MKPVKVPEGVVPYGRVARISRPKLNGAGTHEGVLLQNGIVAHIAADVGVRVCGFEEFRAGKTVQIEAEVPRQYHDAAMLQTQMLLRENAPYDLIANNCEIFARRATLAKPESPQVAFWAIVGFFVGMYALSTR